MGKWKAARIIALTALVAGAVLYLVATVVSDRQVATPEGRTIVFSVSQTDDGKSFDMHSGEVIKITLPENATTGYTWALDNLDTALFSVANKVSDYSGNQIGSGGQISFIISANKTGRGTVSLKNWRPWEGDASVTERFSIKVTVLP